MLGPRTAPSAPHLSETQPRPSPASRVGAAAVSHADAPDQVTALVRALARQAAREAFAASSADGRSVTS